MGRKFLCFVQIEKTVYFLNQKEKNLKDAIPRFLDDVFDVDKPFSKSDLDILTEMYKLLEKNIELEKA